MLSLFPQLLFLTPLAITLLRVVAGLLAITIAWQSIEKRHIMSHMRLPIVGHSPEWLIWAACMLYAVIGGLLVVGAWTQIAALLATLAALKMTVVSRVWPQFVAFHTMTYVLLFVISLSLIFMGAGAFAFDLPL
jgi:uncharacterized membrane protein YphA (DoxX/SURF4 family)